MSKFVVVTFQNEEMAYEGTHALRALDAEGSLTLYGMAVIGKDSRGDLTVKQAADSGPLGTAVGALVGGLLGLIGGPVGAAIGIGAGSVLGSVRDLFHLGVSDGFLDDVAKQLESGKIAVVADVAEDWITPLDTRMEALGGAVVRTWRDEVVDELCQRDLDATRADLQLLEAEFAQARTETRARLKARIDSARAKLQAATDRANTAMEQRQQETEARIQALREQAAKAEGDAKAKLEQRAAALQADSERRSGKLKQALALAKEALTP